ncbi:MAG: GntR family transcriptional regulator [Hyphomonas sp.]
MSAAADHAYSVIRSKIFDGEFSSGDRLKESELSKACDVSRTPVREALRKLAADGLVRIAPNSGAIVAHWSESDIQDIYSVRVRLEALAASLAAQRRTDADLAKLQACADEMKTASDVRSPHENDLEIARLNSDFHHLILAAARSRALAAAASQVIEAPLMLRTFRRYEPQRLMRSVSDHLELVSAIRARDAGLAGSLMEAHILSGLRTLVARPD